MPISAQLIRASRAMAWLSLAGAVIAPAVVVLSFLFPGATPGIEIRINHFGMDALGAAPFEDRMFALVFALVPALIVSWGLISLARMFRGFTQGEIFSSTTLRAFASVTKALLWNVVASFAMQAPISFFLTMHTAHRAVSLDFGSDDVEMLFLAGVAFVIARVMAEAKAMAEENAAFA